MKQPVIHKRYGTILGEPANLTEEQTVFLRDVANPTIQTERIVISEVPATVDFSLSQNAVIYFELFPSKLTSDRGFVFERNAVVTGESD